MAAVYTGIGPTGWWENGQPVSPPPGATTYDPQTGLNASGQPYTGYPNQSGGGGGSYNAFSPETQTYLNQQAEEKARKQAELEAKGYNLESRPYDFDQNAFKNPYYAKDRKFIDDMMKYYRGNDSQFGELGQMYLKGARGEGPSYAQESFKKANEAGIANALALRASSRGNVGAATRMAYNTIGDTNVQNAQNLAVSRIQEVEQNRRGLMDFEKMKGDMTNYFLQQGLNLNQAQWAAGIKLQELQAEQHAQAQSTAAGIKNAKAGRPSFGDQLLAAGLNAASVGVGALFKPGQGSAGGDYYETAGPQYGYSPYVYG